MHDRRDKSIDDDALRRMFGSQGPSDPVDSGDLNRYLDNELSDDETDALFSRLHDDPDAAHELQTISDMVGALGSPVQCPDFSQQILTRVDRQRGLWNGRTRWALRALPYAAVVAVAAAVASVFITQRTLPGVSRIASDDSSQGMVACLENSVRSATPLSTVRSLAAPSTDMISDPRVLREQARVAAPLLRHAMSTRRAAVMSAMAVDLPLYVGESHEQCSVAFDLFVGRSMEAMHFADTACAGTQCGEPPHGSSRIATTVIGLPLGLDLAASAAASVDMVYNNTPIGLPNGPTLPVSASLQPSSR